jgi:hypothetical protein
MLARGPLGASLAARPRLVVAERSGTPRPVGTVPGRTPLRPLVPEAAALGTVAVAALGTVAVAALGTVAVAAVRTVPIAATIAGVARVRTARGARLIAAPPFGAGPSVTIAFRGEPASVPSVPAGLPAGPFPATACRARSAIARPAPVSG